MTWAAGRRQKQKESIQLCKPQKKSSAVKQHEACMVKVSNNAVKADKSPKPREFIK